MKFLAVLMFACSAIWFAVVAASMSGAEIGALPADAYRATIGVVCFALAVVTWTHRA